MRKAAYTLVGDNDLSALNFAHNDSFIFFSTLKEGFSDNVCRSFTIKTAVDGVVHYKINNSYFKVEGNNFLIASGQPFATGYIDSPLPTKSICIYLSQAIMAETFSILSARENFDFDNYLDNYFFYPSFADHISSFDGSGLSRMIAELRFNFHDEKFQSAAITDEWFFELSEKIILFEHDTCKALNGIQSAKYSTKKETLKRLYQARKYMDENFLKNPRISEISKFCNMSQYHFYRSFRQAFNLSPYQYILKKRLEHSALMLNSSFDPLAQIASYCGFIDAFTFSKAFKRHFGIPPSMLRNS